MDDNTIPEELEFIEDGDFDIDKEFVDAIIETGFTMPMFVSGILMLIAGGMIVNYRHNLPESYMVVGGISLFVAALQIYASYATGEAFDYIFSDEPNDTIDDLEQ